MKVKHNYHNSSNRIVLFKLYLSIIKNIMFRFDIIGKQPQTKYFTQNKNYDLIKNSSFQYNIFTRFNTCLLSIDSTYRYYLQIDLILISSMYL